MRYMNTQRSKQPTHNADYQEEDKVFHTAYILTQKTPHLSTFVTLFFSLFFN